MTFIIVAHDTRQDRQVRNEIALFMFSSATTTTSPDQFSGLGSKEAARLRLQYGSNIFKSGTHRGIFRIFWDILKEPMFILLMVACFLYFLLGQRDQGLLMLVAMVLVAAISAYQEVKSSRALDALKKYTEPKVKVIRDGCEQVISSEELVPGDIMVLGEGERIPADALILHANDLSVNEAVLTGESIPVRKDETTDNNLIFQGTALNSGMCYARVTHTGINTTLGQMGKVIEAIPLSRTLLQMQIDRFVKMMALFGLSAFGMIWLVNYLHTGNITQSLLLGLTLAMSAIPEEVPVAFSSFMALGAYRMARLGIIARQPQTIENLGMVSVICLDKTGTLTENSMQVRLLYDFRADLQEDLQHEQPLQHTNVLWWARLACEAAPFDAMEKAIVDACSLHPNAAGYRKLRMVHEYPLEGQPPMMTHVYEDDDRLLVAAKGAPERILRVCKILPGVAEELRKRVSGLASSGYRVLGVCSAQGHEGIYPEQQDHFNWQLEGFVALYDPPKKNVKKVVGQWQQAGIGVKILSGDYVETVQNIAGQAGILQQQQYVTGEQVVTYSPEELKKMVREVNIYARMFPDAKLKVVEALKANGNIVAMTGDGVNDGPALQAAHIGIAMGDKGTDIAREAADLIVSNDDLEKITEAIQHGRTIHSNLKKATRYLISIHIPIILAASLPLLLGWRFPTIFSPIHIIFLELIMGPTCSIFYEREPVEKNIMLWHPRPGGDRLFRGRELPVTLMLGLVTALGLLSVYSYFMQHGYSLEYTRTAVFITLLAANICLTFAGRSFRENFMTTIRYHNSLAPVILFLSVLFMSSLYFIPLFRQLFELTTVRAVHILACLGVAVCSTGWFEVYKFFHGRSSI